MSHLKVHLEDEEYRPLIRLSKQLGVTPELILYTALNRLMEHCTEEEIAQEIHRTGAWRKENLPSWADPSHEIHAYESK